MQSQESAQLGIAFALVCLAGLCAPLGASIVLFMKRSHTGLLAASIALAAGVMVFISLTEVLSDSMEQVKEAGWATPVRHCFVYLAFFGGIILCRGLDWLADGLMKLINKYADRKAGSTTSSRDTSSHHHPTARDMEQQLCSTDSSDGKRHVHKVQANSPKHCSNDCHANKQQHQQQEEADVGIIVTLIPAAPAADECASEHGGSGVRLSTAGTLPEEEHDRAIVAAVEQLADDDNCGHLIRTSILVWLALSLHNVPEGLATMVGYLSSPHLGVTVAVAIAIHNIPEGIALGVPVFFASGSRWKAIGWAAASGLAEPLGALIGLALQLTGRLNPVAMGMIMAVVAGVMTGIALQELLPRALSFDPSNKYTTHGVFAGMAVMAVSLVLLSLWDTST